MFPLWIALLVVCALFGIRLALSGSQSVSGFLTLSSDDTTFVLLFLLLFGMLTAVFVLNIIEVIQRFWHGLLKDEGYLMFTLPVTVRELIISKALSALIISLISVVVAFFCFLLIIMLSAISNITDLSYLWFADFWKQLLAALGKNPLGITGWSIYWIIAVLTKLLENIYHAYTAMAIGQLSNKNRFITSIVAYLGLSAVVSMIVAFPLINIEFSRKMFTSSTEPLTGAMLIILGANILLVAVYHVVTEFLLTKNLNLE